MILGTTWQPKLFPAAYWAVCLLLSVVFICSFDFAVAIAPEPEEAPEIAEVPVQVPKKSRRHRTLPVPKPEHKQNSAHEAAEEPAPRTAPKKSSSDEAPEDPGPGAVPPDGDTPEDVVPETSGGDAARHGPPEDAAPRAVPTQSSDHEPRHEAPGETVHDEPVPAQQRAPPSGPRRGVRYCLKKARQGLVALPKRFGALPKRWVGRFFRRRPVEVPAKGTEEEVPAEEEAHESGWPSLLPMIEEALWGASSGSPAHGAAADDDQSAAEAPEHHEGTAKDEPEHPPSATSADPEPHHKEPPEHHQRGGKSAQEAHHSATKDRAEPPQPPAKSTPEPPHSAPEHPPERLRRRDAWGALSYSGDRPVPEFIFGVGLAVLPLLLLGTSYYLYKYLYARNAMRLYDIPETGLQLLMGVLTALALVLLVRSAGPARAVDCDGVEARDALRAAAAVAYPVCGWLQSTAIFALLVRRADLFEGHERWQRTWKLFYVAGAAACGLAAYAADGAPAGAAFPLLHHSAFLYHAVCIGMLRFPLQDLDVFIEHVRVGTFDDDSSSAAGSQK